MKKTKLQLLKTPKCSLCGQYEETETLIQGRFHRDCKENKENIKKRLASY